ncbi:MAG: UPF0145 protein Bcep18194_B0595, partial [uncultured Chloroflexia bacterium]
AARNKHGQISADRPSLHHDHVRASGLPYGTKPGCGPWYHGSFAQHRRHVRRELADDRRRQHYDVDGNVQPGAPRSIRAHGAARGSAWRERGRRHALRRERGVKWCHRGTCVRNRRRGRAARSLI